ncbi:F-box family protein [Striga asiatica]|uniref:F-box family protein n=1 Tax=Striga asiatica TaxID=4170 RepID=A0A5A7PP94_STRAF|nr:F-box family protein [Striga asiatica]
MKRSLDGGEFDCPPHGCSDANKKIRQGEGKIEKVDLTPKNVEAVLLDENLLYEVLRHVDDGRTLAKAACVSRQWRRTAQDDRLWELICTRHYHRSPMQLRAVVLALGGFRRLYSTHLWPLLKPAAPSPSAPPASSAWPGLPPAPAPPTRAGKSKARWGKDEVNLSLSLLSIKCFEKMGFNNPSK